MIELYFYCVVQEILTEFRSRQDQIFYSGRGTKAGLAEFFENVLLTVENRPNRTVIVLCLHLYHEPQLCRENWTQ